VVLKINPINKQEIKVKGKNNNNKTRMRENPVCFIDSVHGLFSLGEKPCKSF